MYDRNVWKMYKQVMLECYRKVLKGPYIIKISLKTIKNWY